MLYNNEEGRMVYHMTTIIKYLTHTKQGVAYTHPIPFISSSHMHVRFKGPYSGTEIDMGKYM